MAPRWREALRHSNVLSSTWTPYKPIVHKTTSSALELVGKGACKAAMAAWMCNLVEMLEQTP